MAHSRSSHKTAPSAPGFLEGCPIELGAIPKNSREEIRITAEHFKGRDIINFRVWYRDAEGEMRPGKHGLAFRTDLLPAVLEALDQVHQGPIVRIDLPVKPALLSYCRKLVAEGADPSELVHVYRGGSLCFQPVPLATFAKLATEERSDRSILFARHRETLPRSDGYASAMAIRNGCAHG